MQLEPLKALMQRSKLSFWCSVLMFMCILHVDSWILFSQFRNLQRSGRR